MSPQQSQTFDTIVQTQFQDALPELQVFLTSDEYDTLVEGIAEYHGLDQQVKNSLSNEVTLFCLGLTNIETLEASIKTLAGDDSTGETIMNDVAEMILEDAIGLIPVAPSPRVEALLSQVPEEVESASVTGVRPQTSERNTVPVSRTMHADIAGIKEKAKKETGKMTDDKSTKRTDDEPPAPIPRYAKPLTDTPRYGSNE